MATKNTIKGIFDDIKRSQLEFKRKMDERTVKHQKAMLELMQKRKALTAKPQDKSIAQLKKIVIPSGPITRTAEEAKRAQDNHVAAENARLAAQLAVVVPKGKIVGPAKPYGGLFNNTERSAATNPPNTPQNTSQSNVRKGRG